MFSKESTLGKSYDVSHYYDKWKELESRVCFKTGTHQPYISEDGLVHLYNVPTAIQNAPLSGQHN